MSYDHENTTVYCIVPGFLGNYSDGFTKRLFDYLTQKKKNVQCISFYGHKKSEKKLWNLNEMQAHLTTEVRGLFNNPLFQNQKIVLLAHSQGCVVTLHAIKDLDTSIDIKLLAPAIYIDEIILPRISTVDIAKIQKSQKPILCKVSQKNSKLLDQKWIDSYRDYFKPTNLLTIDNNCHIIYPTDDFIDQKNALIVKNILPHAKMDIINSNHFFDKNESDLQTLAKTISL